MRITAGFSRLRLPEVWIRSVSFEPDRVVVGVASRRRRLVSEVLVFDTASREPSAPSVGMAHLDLRVWRLEIRAGLRRVRCHEHGAHVESVPFARAGARFTRDFENLVAWLATTTD